MVSLAGDQMREYSMVRGVPFPSAYGIERGYALPKKILGVLPLKVVHSGAFLYYFMQRG